ncbi:hypothetical protein QAD02_011456 [Eretmocerus hayati]|uniref:Uncharacterized protein n=1 Tax=Eretmocerus hayati TaxID=131215 RepID=A0ACC2NWH8_9HYME|nr:hypothetical protein QAD02_011456 [Eretmocerus hayati]
MKFSIVFTISTLLFNSIQSFEIDEPFSNFVADICSVLFYPTTTLSTLLCAEIENIARFSKILSKYRVLSNHLNLTTYNETKIRSSHQLTLLVDIDCPGVREVLQKANDTGMFSAPLKWLIVQEISEDKCANCSDRSIPDYFKKMTWYPDSDVILLRRENGNFFKILSIYRPSSFRDMIVENRGTWTPENGFQLNDTDVASRRRQNLQLTPIKSSIVVTHTDSAHHLNNYHDKHIDTITKISYRWLQHLVNAMNATLDNSLVGSFGKRDINGSWNGLTGQLSRKEIDIGGTAIPFDADRFSDIQYIPLSIPIRSAFIFRLPPLSVVSNLFIQPFSKSVWIAIIALLFLIFCCLFIVTKWEWNSRLQDISSKPTWTDNLLTIVGVFAQQGFGMNPTTTPSRMVLLMLLISGITLYASFSANIVALLQSATNSIQNLEDLLYSPIECGAHSIDSNLIDFKLESDPLRRAIIDRKIESIKNNKSNWLSAEDGLSRVRQGFFAFFMETSLAYKIIQDKYEEDEKCFNEIYFMDHANPTFAVVKQSPYLEIIRVKNYMDAEEEDENWSYWEADREKKSC